MANRHFGEVDPPQTVVFESLTLSLVGTGTNSYHSGGGFCNSTLDVVPDPGDAYICNVRHPNGCCTSVEGDLIGVSGSCPSGY